MGNFETNRRGSKKPSESSFARFFYQPEKMRKRGTFLSRVLGIFSEELVRIWAADERAPYRDLGRPRLFYPESEKGYSLDFTFEDRVTSERYVVEMKCEIEYQNYRFLTLRAAEQLDHHKKPAFDLFKSAARDPDSVIVKFQRKAKSVDGAILIWGDVSEEGGSAVMAHYGFRDVIGLNRILDDLWEWRPKEFEELVSLLADWSFELFNFLGGGEKARMQIFKNDEAGFIAWRDTHPGQFICNVPNPNGRDGKRYYLNHVCVHTSRCHQLAANKNGEQPWTTNGYFKICADSVERIENWLKRNANTPSAWAIKRCKKCAP